MPHIFAIGDVVGQPMLAHKAVHEGKVAAEAASGMKTFFDAAVIPSVAYTDPEVAWVGLTENEAKAKGIKYGKGVFPWAASGRSLALGRDEGSTKLLFDEATHRLLGCGIVGPGAGELVAEAGARHRDGGGRHRYRPHHPRPPDLVGIDRHGGRDVRGHHHRPDRPQEEALAQRRPTMAVKQDFAKQLESQIAVWQAQIKEHQDKMAQAGAAATAEAKAAYEKSVTALQAQTEQATKLLAETRTASEAAWHDIQAASAKAFEQLQQGWADALKRFG